ncbi:MAG: tetratricopeptide repeat protein, partial [Desulfobulbaceae bacterium]|nr:tetratricopeptide repeat protein [Desulfobulbaceae bacterium]
SKDYLRLAANLSPAVIPNAFAEKVFALSDGLEKTLARKFTRQAIAGCYNNSLVKPVGNSQQVHALTSAVVQYLGWSMDERAAAIRADAIDSLTETIQSDITHDEAVKIGPELEHARHLTAGGIGEVELNLLYKLARFDDYRGYFQQAMESYKRLLTYYQDENGPDHPDTLTIMGNLAFTLREMGDYSAAKELEEKVLEQRTRILGPDHLDTLTSMDNLAGSLGAMGDHKGAKKLAEKVFKSRKKVLGPDHPDTLKSMGNIAMLFEAMGEYTSAKKLAEKVFEQSTRILGPDHPDTLTFMNNMAGIMVLTGEYKQAKQLFAQIIEIRKENLGSDHPDTLTSMNNMAGTLWNMGEYKEAKQILTQVFEIRREALGLDHPQTLKTMSNLAENLKAIGDHKGAKQIQEQVLEDMKEILGPDHPDTLASMGNLGNILFETGDQIGAKQLQEEALKYRNKTLGPDHSDTLTSMHNLARVLSAMEDHNGAKQLQELALKGMKEIFGSDHPNTTVIAWHLFKTLINLNEMQASARVMCEYLLWLLDDNITIHNRNQQNIRDSIKELNTNMSSLAKAMVDIGEYNRAKKILVPELERRAQTLGPDHPDTTSAAWNLYATLLQLREINGAKKIISKHLLWLLEENVTLRDSDQKQIRDNLKKILDGTHWFKNRESLQYGGPESSLSTTYRKLRYYVRRLLGV